MLITSDLTAGLGSNYNTRCILPLTMLSLSFLRSVGLEKRLPEVGWGIFAECMKPEVGVQGV